jgi:hypothetical protein
MLRSAKFAVAAAALMLAAPAMASDFSGIGRIFMWGFVAIGVLIAVPVVLIRRQGQSGSRGGSAFLSLVVGIMLAPGIAIRDYDQWVFTLFPGTGVAMLEGSWAVLFPVPLISMLVCGLGMFRMLERGRPDTDGPDAAP